MARNLPRKKINETNDLNISASQTIECGISKVGDHS